jgi:hypothetical protein
MFYPENVAYQQVTRGAQQRQPLSTNNCRQNGPKVPGHVAIPQKEA